MTWIVASWNVNSLRVRLPLVLQFLEQNQPDILALQETKVEDKLFPVNAIQEAGYYALFHGQKQYNGVAILSKYPLQGGQTSFSEYQDNSARILSATLGKLKVIVIYAPNGNSLDSDAYQYKLQWFYHLIHYIRQAVLQYSAVLVLGDYNIAPADEDLYDPIKLKNQLLTSLAERIAFQNLLKHRLHDCFRLCHHEPGYYTWWDYRSNAFQRQQGLRIDHILCSDDLARHCYRCEIDIQMRKAVRPSDHAAIIAYFRKNYHDFI